MAVRNASASPCAVICVLCVRADHQWARYGGSSATPAMFGDLEVFTPDRHHGPR